MNRTLSIFLSILFSFGLLIPMASAATSDIDLSGYSLKEDTYEKPTMAKSILEYYGYHNDQFFPGVSWDVYHTLSDQRDVVFAPMNGTIVSIDQNDAMGKFLLIQHSDYLYTLLGNLAEVSVNVGDVVATKEIIAKVVADEPLYHEVTYNGAPLDPASVIGYKADDFQYFYTEAVDEIEKGPYTLISDLDIKSWGEVTEASFRAAVGGEGDGGGTEGNSTSCSDLGGTREVDGETQTCCETECMDEGVGYWITAECGCPVWNRIVCARINRNKVQEQIFRSSPFGERQGSILDMMCWDQLQAIKGQAGKAYQAPNALVGPYEDFNSLVNTYVSPVVQGWREGFWAENSDITNIPGLIVLSYMRAQQFLDRAVDLINNAVRGFIGSLLNSITGGFLGSLGLEKEFACDMMFRLWNVADDCFDMKMPRIPDLLNRIQLPGLPCALESFAYGGSGLREAHEMINQPLRDEYVFHGLDSVIDNAWQVQQNINQLNRQNNQGGWQGNINAQDLYRRLQGNRGNSNPSGGQ